MSLKSVISAIFKYFWKIFAALNWQYIDDLTSFPFLKSDILLELFSQLCLLGDIVEQNHHLFLFLKIHVACYMWNSSRYVSSSRAMLTSPGGSQHSMDTSRKSNSLTGFSWLLCSLMPKIRHWKKWKLYLHPRFGLA